MPSIRSLEDLLERARDFEDVPLETVTGRLFTVRVFRDRELVFTPVSSGLGQSDGRRAQQRFVATYAASGSLRPVDYARVSRNASYLIGLLMAIDAAPRGVRDTDRVRRRRSASAASDRS